MDTHVLSVRGVPLRGLVQRWCADCRSTHLFTTLEESAPRVMAPRDPNASGMERSAGSSTAADSAFNSSHFKREDRAVES